MANATGGSWLRVRSAIWSERELSVRTSNRWLNWLPEISVVLVTSLAGVLAAGRWLDPTGDPGIWWSTVYRLASGEVLYRDVYLQFGPLSPYVLSVGARVFGASASYMLLANWIPALAAGVLLLHVARPLVSLLERFAIAGLLLSESLLAPGPGRLLFPYASGAVHALLLSTAAILVASGNSSRRSGPFLAAGCAGLAFCAKQEIGLACLLALLASTPLQPRAAGRAARLLLGFSAVALLLAVAVLGSAPAASLRDHSHLWPIAPYPPEQWNHLYKWVAGVSFFRWEKLVFGWAWEGLCCIAAISFVGLLLGREKNPSDWIPTTVLVAGLCLAWPAQSLPAWAGFRPTSLSMLAAVVAALMILTGPKFAGAQTALSLSVFAALVGARAAFSTERTEPYSGVAHFATAFTWVLLLCRLVPNVMPGGARSSFWARRIWGATLLLVSINGTARGAAALASLSKQTVLTPQGRIAVPSRVTSFFQAIGTNLRPGERVWVLPEINGVDALFLAREVSPYPSHLPGWLDENAEAELIRRVEQKRPDVVILFDRNTKEYGVAPFGEGYDRLLAEWVDRHYAPVVETSAGKILRPRNVPIPSP